MKQEADRVGAYQELGHWLRQVRAENALTLKQVAERTGISHAQINRIELGLIGRISVESLIRLSKLYGVSSRQIFDRLSASEVEQPLPTIVRTKRALVFQRESVTTEEAAALRAVLRAMRRAR